MNALIQKKGQPVVAVLTYPDKRRIFRGNKQNFIDLIRTGKEHGVLIYITTTKDFRLADSEVPGYTYHSSTGTWKKKHFPFPQVVYNRIPYRKFEMLPEVQQVIKACLRHEQIRFFNPSFFNKWTLFEWLNQGKETREIIPDTHQLTSSADLEQMVHEHSSVFLKPVRGKAGKGIMKVSRQLGKPHQEKWMYVLSVQDKTGSYISRFPTVARLWEQFRQMSGNREYLIQQGIRLATYKKRPFDLRVLVQKNGKGEWTVAGVGARVAGKFSITTHVPRGGKIDRPLKLLSAGFGAEESKRIIVRARKTAISAAKQIERASGQTLGEMSMDLGVDSKGSIWFFEANSKPMKFDEPPIRKRSLNNLINYSIFLSRKKRTGAAISGKPVRRRRALRRISGHKAKTGR